MVAMATAVRIATPSIHSSLLGESGRNVWYSPSAREVTAAIHKRTYLNEENSTKEGTYQDFIMEGHPHQLKYVLRFPRRNSVLTEYSPSISKVLRITTKIEAQSC